jgi:starch synthase
MNNLFFVIDATNKGAFGKLTRHRMPGALPFGAKYRLIDFTLSNCKNSVITNVAIFPYGNYRSLADHIGSGDRWDLNRRKDGIFILPPKNLNLTYEEQISFQRMYEHLEYFVRSSQEYVIVSPANIVWNVDYNVVLHHHLVHNADVTEVLNENGERLRTFLLAKKILLEYIEHFDSISFRNLTEVFDYALGLERSTYVFEEPSFLIDSPRALFEANMALLEPAMRDQVFKKSRPVFSKETMSSPSRYGPKAFVKNSVVASGAVVDGRIYKTIVGRKATIGEGATIDHSIIMNQCVIEPGAIVSHAILDKETIVKAGAIVRGTIDQLFIAEKKQIVTNDEELTVLQLAVECVPYVKTGGLADVVGALAKELSNQGVVSLVMMPLFPRIREKFQLFFEPIAETIIRYDNQPHRVSLYGYNDRGVMFYFIENFEFFDRENIYGYADDGDRFAFFSLAAMAFFDVFPKRPDVVHLHDWHLGLTPLLFKHTEGFQQVKTLLTIHNVEYQGVHPSSILAKLSIDSDLKNYPNINFLEIGLNHATKISTVSPTYRDELKYEYYSKNLVDLINRRDRDFYGILNGLTISMSPQSDLQIARRYDALSVASAKPENKHFLQREMGLPEGDDYFVIGMVSRLVEQKGFDIVFAGFDQMMQNDKIQFILLGTGDQHFMDTLTHFAHRYPNRVKMNLAYDATEPSYIYAGADVFLMPSRYEPCGTSQMIALKYGTIPIVRQTGGLNDTIEQYNAVSKKGNGFKFYNYDGRDLVFQIQNAYQLWRLQSEWATLVQNAMRSEFSFVTTAKAYAELYQMMM